ITTHPLCLPMKSPCLSRMTYRQAWAVAAAKFGTDPVWWLYLFWVPDFLHRPHGIDLQAMALPLVVIYLTADVGSIAGGWLSSALLKRGWTPNRARTTTMFVCGLGAVPIALAPGVHSEWAAVIVVG